MPLIRVGDTRELRELCREELKKLRKDRKITIVFLWTAYVLGVFWAIDLYAGLYFRHWQTVATAITGWLLVCVLVLNQRTSRRTYVLRAKLVRAQLKILKNMEHININIDVSLLQEPTPKPKPN